MAQNHLDVFTKQALANYGHEGVTEHYRRLRDTRALHATRCTACQQAVFPPRSFCPECFHSEVEWVEIARGATLYAYTTQHRSLRFMAPAVIGVVEIPDVGLVLAPIKGDYGELKIGQPLKMEVVELGENLLIHQFVPAD